jgi:hypothetical protein
VSPDRDEPTEDQEQELYEDVPPRSIFAATWFRVVLVVIVLGVIGAVAVPYVLDWMNPPPPPRTASKMPGASTPAPSIFDKPASTSDAPAMDKPVTDKPIAEKPDKKDSSTLIPAPAPTPSVTPAPAAPPKPEPKSEPRPAPAPGAKAAPESKPVPKPAPAPPRPAPPESTGKTAAAVTDSPAKPPAAASKSEPKAATATKPSSTKPAVAKATAPAAASGPFWVQVGAFKDPETAKRLATKLRDANFKVEESVRSAGAPSAPAATKAAKPAPTAPSGSDQYDVFVTGMSVEELNKKLSGRGLAAETSGAGVVVKPSLPLRDAVALSKDLATEGFKVQVRRAGGAAAAPSVTPPAPSASQEGGTPLHRVRVGAFTDRAAALAAARELEAKGYKPFIARGDQ